MFNKHGELMGIVLSIVTTFDGIANYLSYLEINEVIQDLRAGMKK